MNVIIENEKFKAEISTFGAEIQHLVKKTPDGECELIWNGDKSVWKNHAPILFPFVARCLDGYFIIDGKKCEYSRNHGFARDLESKIIKKEKDCVIFELTESDDTIYRFPYKFSLQSQYKVCDKGLEWKLTVKNTDSKDFYFGIGSHAAFTIPRNTDSKDTKFTDYEIVFEKQEKLTNVICNEDGYLAGDGNQTKPYGEKTPGVIPLDGKGFGNGHLFTNFTSDWVGLRNKKDSSILKISTKGFPYCMIWQNTSGPAQFVCIEPWHGIPDTENTNHIWEEKKGMNLLKSGQSFSCNQDIFF